MGSVKRSLAGGSVGAGVNGGVGTRRAASDERWRGVRFGVIFVCTVAAFLLSISASQGWIQFSWRGSPILGQPRLEGGVYDLQSIQVLNRALLHLHENYVDPARFSPKLMLSAGLDEVQKQVAEVTVTFDKPLSEQPEQGRGDGGGQEADVPF